MKKNDALKKHHFWLLLGFVPLFTLIGAMIVSSSVGGAIAERQKKLDDAKSKIGPKVSSAKPKALIQEAAKLVETVSGKQGGLHKENWDRQKNLFTWPASSPLLREVELGEANVEKAADRIVEAGLPKDLKEADRAAKAKEVRDELAKLTPLDRVARLKDMLNQLPLSPAQRKALMEPAWPKFGDPLPNDRGEFDEFKKSDVYRAQFSTLKKDGSGGPGTGMADRIAPTQFFGGWERVLRHVNDFGAGQLNKDQVWLMMEDIWVQRSLLDAVRTINEEMTGFRRAKFDKDGNAPIDRSFDESGNKVQVAGNGQPVLDRRTGRPAVIPTPEEERRKALFANRTWAVQLEIVREGTSQRLTGTITNLTDRLQLLGVGNIMTLNVWFRNSAQPMAFRIGGEYVPGKGATKVVRTDGKEQTKPANVLDIVPMEDHVLPPGSDPNAELLRIEQVFDVRTVPVKRIDALVLGALDSRNAAATLLPPNSPPFAPEPPAPAATDPNASPMGAPGTPAPGGLVIKPGFAGGTGPDMMGGTGQAAKWVRAGGGPLPAVIDANKKRYLITSTEVRRMPVGIVLVVDQSLIQDVLLAFANSPLRFQITQVVWTSFTGKLEGTAPAAGSTGDGGVDFGSGTVNVAGPSDPDSRPGPMGLGTPMPGALFPGGRRPLGPGSITLPFGAGGAPGSTPFGGAGSPYGRQASTVSESQITSGLVELSIYGIVSLYEKYDPQKPAEGAAGPATTPTTTAAPKEVTQPKEPKDAKEPKEPKDAKEPMPKEPTPKQPAKEPMPMATEPTPPAKKMRRRR